jgi:hypothetical protein
MKKIITLILAALMILSLCACSHEDPPAPTIDLPEEEIFTKTIHDFEGHRIENLDQKENTNFIAYAKGVKEITVSSTTNTLLNADYENLSYTFTNADKALRSLRKGDVFFAPISEACPEGVTAKVKKIEKSGDQVTVYSEELGFADLFEYIDIFMEVPVEMPSPSLKDNRFITLSNNRNTTRVPTKNTVTGKAVFTKGPATISFETYVTIQTVTVKLRFSRENMQLFCDLLMDTTYGGFMDLEGEWSPDQWKKTLAVVPLRIGALITIPVELNAIASVDGKTSSHLEFKESRQTGFTSSVSSRNCTYQPINQVLNPMNFINSYCGKMEAQANLALEAKPTLRIGFLGKFYGSFTHGLNITAQMGPLVEIPEKEDDSTIHLCDICVDGDLNYFSKLGIGLEVKLSEKLEKIIEIDEVSDALEDAGVEVDEEHVGITVNTFTKKIADFYVTELDEKWDFGWGICPNMRYKTTVTLKDSKGNPASNTKLTLYLPDETQEQVTADQDGIAVVYLPAGNNTLKARLGKDFGRCDLQIKDQPTEAEIAMRETELHIEISTEHYDGVKNQWSPLMQATKSTPGYSMLSNTLTTLFPDAIILNESPRMDQEGDMHLIVTIYNRDVPVLVSDNNGEPKQIRAAADSPYTFFMVFYYVDNDISNRRMNYQGEFDVDVSYDYFPTWEDEYGLPINGATTKITGYNVQISLSAVHPYEQYSFTEIIPVNTFNGISLTAYGTNPAYRYVLLDLGISYLERLKPYVEGLRTNPPTT